MPRPHGASVRRRAVSADRQIRAIQLRFDGLSTPEIAAKLGISQPAAWGLVRRGLDRWLAKAGDLAGELFHIEFARLEQTRAKLVQAELDLRAHLAELTPNVSYQVQVPIDGAVDENGKPRIRTETRINTRVAARVENTVAQLIRVAEAQIRLSERLSRLAGLDKKTQETQDMESLAAELMQVAAEVRQEYEEAERRALVAGPPSPTDALTFEDDVVDVNPVPSGSQGSAG